MLSKEYVEKKLRDGGYLDIFAAAAHAALQSWLDTVASSPKTMAGALPREKAAHVNRRVVEIICEKLRDDPRVAINTIHQATLITIDNEITLRFKKLRRDYRAINTRTRRVELLWHKNMKPFPGDFEKWINVTFGWIMGAAGTIKDLSIVFELHDRVEWRFEVTGSGATVQQITQLPLVETTEETPVYVAKLRDTARARRIAEEKANNETDEAK